MKYLFKIIVAFVVMILFILLVIDASLVKVKYQTDLLNNIFLKVLYDDEFRLKIRNEVSKSRQLFAIGANSLYDFNDSTLYSPTIHFNELSSLLNTTYQSDEMMQQNEDLSVLEVSDSQSNNQREANQIEMLSNHTNLSSKYTDLSSNQTIIRNKQYNDFTQYNLFYSDSELISFVKYIKTQSNDLTTTKGNIDNYLVIQVMLNRLIHNQVNWTKYFNNPSINNSASIRKIKTNKIKVTFSADNKSDRMLIERVKRLIEGDYSEMNEYEYDLILPSNVLYFESFKRCPNKGVHKLKNIYTFKNENGENVSKFKHRFYTN